MKISIAIACAFIAISGSLHSEEKNLSPTEKSERRAEMIKRTGGVYWTPPQGFVCIVNCQAKADFAKVSAKFSEMFKGFDVQTKSMAEQEPFNIRFLKSYRSKIGAGMVVFVVNDPDLPMSLAAIEERSGLVNVAALAVDSPPQPLLDRRVGKLACRVATLACGGAESKGVNCMMKPVTNIAELDSNEAQGDEAYVMMGMINGLSKEGVLPPRRMTYRQACVLGIAPDPTNDIQRAVMNDVKLTKERGPINGLKILP